MYKRTNYRGIDEKLVYKSGMENIIIFSKRNQSYHDIFNIYIEYIYIYIYIKRENFTYLKYTKLQSFIENCTQAFNYCQQDFFSVVILAGYNIIDMNH